MKYYVASDIHSGFSAYMTALKEAGYDENDENSKLIICGDAFDRGFETINTFDSENDDKNTKIFNNKDGKAKSNKRTNISRRAKSIH